MTFIKICLCATLFISFPLLAMDKEEINEIFIQTPPTITTQYQVLSIEEELQANEIALKVTANNIVKCGEYCINFKPTDINENPIMTNGFSSKILNRALELSLEKVSPIAWIHISGWKNFLTDVSTISKMKRLHQLVLNGVNIDYLDLSGMENLGYLFISGPLERVQLINQPEILKFTQILH